MTMKVAVKMAVKASLKTKFLSSQTLSLLFGSIWTHSICQMQAVSPGVEFSRTLSRDKKRNKTFLIVSSHPPQNVALGGFALLLCSGRQINVLKA